MVLLIAWCKLICVASQTSSWLTTAPVCTQSCRMYHDFILHKTAYTQSLLATNIVSTNLEYTSNHLLNMAPKSKSTKSAKQATKPAETQQQPAPNWPPLTPVLPADSLTLETLLPNQIVTISNLWTSTLCAKYVAFLRSLPLTTTPGIPKKGDAVRVNDRFQIDDAAFAQRLWSETGLSEIVGSVEDPKLWGGEVLGLNPNIRIYRYSKGQFFDQHCKCPVFPSNETYMLTKARRRLKQYHLHIGLSTKRCSLKDHVDAAALPHIACHWLQRWRDSFLPRPS
jgi:hypothetical protein